MVTELKSLGHSRARYRFELANVRTSEGIVFENGVVVPDREISVWARGPFSRLDTEWPEWERGRSVAEPLPDGRFREGVPDPAT